MGRPRLLSLRKSSIVPVAKYFMVAGSVLTALLMIAGWSLPEAPASFPDRTEHIGRAAIRITSEHKWPEKIVLDTSQPTFAPAPIEEAPIQRLAEELPDEMVSQATVDAVTKPSADARPIDAHPRSARSGRKKGTVPSTRVAKIAIRREQVTLAMSDECCRLEWGIDKPALSKAGTRKRVARPDPWAGWHF
jgi:hypothetical protein